MNSVSLVVHKNNLQKPYPWFFLLICLLFTFPVSGQYTSRLGRFTVSEIKGCAPLTITLATTPPFVLECTAARPCLMDYLGNNQQQQNLFNFTYTTPGIYKLSVLFQSIGADDIDITVDQNIQPPFEIYSCAGSRVSIKINDNNYDQFVIDFNNDATPEIIIPKSNNQVATHNYGAPGNFVINVRGRDFNSADNCAANLQNFSAINLIPAAVINTLTVTDANNIDLAFTPSPNIQYKSLVGVNSATNLQQFQTLYGVTTLNIPNLQTDNNFYCIRLNSFDPCNSTNVPSNTICSADFDVNPQSEVNKLVWATSLTGVSTFSISRNSAPYVVTPAVLLFDDTNVVCETDYTYQLTTNYSNGSRSTSLAKLGRAFDSDIPTPIDNTSAVVTATGLDLSWTQDPLSTALDYSILRSQDGGILLTIDHSATIQYTDAGYSISPKYCYRIDYTDVCANNSPPGISFCPILLTGSLDNQNGITISWNSFDGWTNGVQHYIVQKFRGDGSSMGSFNVGLDTFLVDNVPDPINQVVEYIVRANPNQGGLIHSVSNRLVMTREAHLIFPTAFTPNGDNLNDRFTVRGQYVAELNLKIFDRWGSLVFFTSDHQSWDGRRDGKMMPESSYIWKAEITDLSGKRSSAVGSVALLQN